MLWQLPLLRLSPPGFDLILVIQEGFGVSSGVSAERSPWEGLGRGSWARYLRLRQWGPPLRGCAGRGSMGILMTEGGGNWGRNGEIPGEGSAWQGSGTAWSSQRDPKPPEEEEEALPSSSQIPGQELHRVMGAVP